MIVFSKKRPSKVTLMAALVAGFLSLFSNSTFASEGANDTSVYLVIHFKTHSDHQQEFKKIMAGVEKAMTGEAGFQTAQVYRGAEDDREFILVERWQSITLHREHYDRIVASGDWAHILTLLTEEPTMTYTHPLPVSLQ